MREAEMVIDWLDKSDDWRDKQNPSLPKDKLAELAYLAGARQAVFQLRSYLDTSHKEFLDEVEATIKAHENIAYYQDEPANRWFE